MDKIIDPNIGAILQECPRHMGVLVAEFWADKLGHAVEHHSTFSDGTTGGFIVYPQERNGNRAFARWLDEAIADEMIDQQAEAAHAGIADNPGGQINSNPSILVQLVDEERRLPSITGHGPGTVYFTPKGSMSYCANKDEEKRLVKSGKFAVKIAKVTAADNPRQQVDDYNKKHGLGLKTWNYAATTDENQEMKDFRQQWWGGFNESTTTPAPGPRQMPLFNPGGFRQRERGVREVSHHFTHTAPLSDLHAQQAGWRRTDIADPTDRRNLHSESLRDSRNFRSIESHQGRGFGGHIAAERAIVGNPKKGQPCITVVKGKKVIATGSAMSDLAECKALAKKHGGVVLVAEGCAVQGNGPRTKPDHFARSSISPQGALVLRHHAAKLPSTEQVIADADANRQWYVCGPCLDADPEAPCWLDGPIEPGEFAGIPTAACDYLGVAHADGCDSTCWPASVHTNGPRSHAAGRRVGQGAKVAGHHIAKHAKAAGRHVADFGRGVLAGVKGNHSGLTDIGVPIAPMCGPNGECTPEEKAEAKEYVDRGYQLWVQPYHSSPKHAPQFALLAIPPKAARSFP